MIQQMHAGVERLLRFLDKLSQSMLGVLVAGRNDLDHRDDFVLDEWRELAIALAFWAYA